MSFDFGVLVFPGSNCDRDCYSVVERVLKRSVKYVWYEDGFSPKDYRCIVLPGGFSYGDYLRAGAMARYSRAMDCLIGHAEKGGLVIGSCNGFQILLEAGLLPGAMLRNKGLKFICKDIYVRVERDDTPFSGAAKSGDVLRLPIAHNQGFYFNDEEGLRKLEASGQVLLRYSSPDGQVDDRFNPNGSLNNIAGIVSKAGNVLGLMPHPERCSESLLGNTDGRIIFTSIIKSFIDQP